MITDYYGDGEPLTTDRLPRTMPPLSKAKDTVDLLIYADHKYGIAFSTVQMHPNLRKWVTKSRLVEMAAEAGFSIRVFYTQMIPFGRIDMRWPCV